MLIVSSGFSQFKSAGSTVPFSANAAEESVPTAIAAAKNDVATRFPLTLQVSFFYYVKSHCLRR